jgi:hypothetical protein
MDRQPQPKVAAEPTAAEGFTPAQIRTLKIAIVVMSIILVVGFCAILARLFYLASRPSPPATSAAIATLHPPSPLMPDIALALPPGANVRAMSLAPAGDHLAVHFDAPTGAEIVILDLRSGKRASRVRLTTAP